MKNKLSSGSTRAKPLNRPMKSERFTTRLVPEGFPIAFELDKDSGFRWIDCYDITIDDLLNGTVWYWSLPQGNNVRSVNDLR